MFVYSLSRYGSSWIYFTKSWLNLRLHELMYFTKFWEFRSFCVQISSLLIFSSFLFLLELLLYRHWLNWWYVPAFKVCWFSFVFYYVNPLAKGLWLTYLNAHHFSPFGLLKSSVKAIFNLIIILSISRISLLYYFWRKSRRWVVTCERLERG